ncbi:MAG: hypothetical protein KME12_08575 [Trichocoleus desertorum ATA4-8-CV12]|jgi:hypothetical protein|nr:hypothetical protein [Trichocoleus desertorum ATA4-8-CV12]
MTELPEIEAAIKQLLENDICQLAIWLQDYLDEMWDQQIEADFTSGKLDRLIAQAESEIAANQVVDLDEVLRDRPKSFCAG